MKKILIQMIVISSLLGCSNDKMRTEQDVFALMQGDPNYLEICSIRDQLLYKLFRSGASEDELAYAYVHNDMNKLRHYYGLSDSELNSLLNRVSLARELLLKKYPEINTYIGNSNKKCLTCESNDSIIRMRLGNLKRIYNQGSKAFPLKSLNEGVPPEWQPEDPGWCINPAYSICVIASWACGEAMPLCAAMCVCAYCDHRWWLYRLLCDWSLDGGGGG
jgi:hypothetical protein